MKAANQVSHEKIPRKIGTAIRAMRTNFFLTPPIASELEMHA